jgi:hypothetical protein
MNVAASTIYLVQNCHPIGALTVNIKIHSTVILPDDCMDVNLGLSQ